MNKMTYERRKVVGWYGGLDGLYEAEKTILRLMLDQNPALDMIDIGIGGGRTTKHFAQHCKSYIGLDYSAAMVEEAQRTCPPRTTVIHADARDMRAVPDGSADFVLFSFNGIDYVSHEDRLTILREVRRICRPGAHFALSAHNLAAARHEFAWRGNLIKGLAWFILTRTLNFPLFYWTRRPYARLNDGAHRFSLRTYYVTPQEQLRQLAGAGFTSVRMFGFYTGRETTPDDRDDPFPYYLCVAG